MRWSDVGDDVILRNTIIITAQTLYRVTRKAIEAWLKEFNPDVIEAVHHGLLLSTNSEQYNKNLKHIIWGRMTDEKIQAACEIPFHGKEELKDAKTRTETS